MAEGIAEGRGLPSLSIKKPNEAVYVLPRTMTEEQLDGFAEKGELTPEDEEILRSLGDISLLLGPGANPNQIAVALYSRMSKDGDTEHGYVITGGQNVGDKIRPAKYEDYGLSDPAQLAVNRERQAELQKFLELNRPLKDSFNMLIAMQSDMDSYGVDAERLGRINDGLRDRFEYLDRLDETDITVASQLAIAAATPDSEMSASFFDRAVSKLGLDLRQRPAFTEAMDRLLQLKSRNPGLHAEDARRQVDGFVQEVKKNAGENKGLVLAAWGIVAGASLGNMAYLQDGARRADEFVKSNYSSNKE